MQGSGCTNFQILQGTYKDSFSLFDFLTAPGLAKHFGFPRRSECDNLSAS